MAQQSVATTHPNDVYVLLTDFKDAIFFIKGRSKHEPSLVKIGAVCVLFSAHLS